MKKNISLKKKFQKIKRIMKISQNLIQNAGVLN